MGKKVLIDVTELGRAGGLATAAARTPEERRAYARMMAAARWAGHVAKRPASSRKKKATK
jgi:hypothetical protein